MPKAKAKTKRDKRPTYSEMIQIAITDLKEIKGSSKQSIQKYIYANYPIEESKNTNRYIENALKTGIKNGSIIIEGTGRNKAFRVGEIKTKSANKEPLKVEDPSQKNTGKRGKQKYKTDDQLKEEISQSERHKDIQTESISDTPENSMEANLKKPSLSDLEAERLDSIYLKLPDDEHDCEILGVDVDSRGRIVVADRLNGTVKIFDQEGQFMTSYKVSEKMDFFFIAISDDEELLISLAPAKQIFIMQLDFNEISVRRTIQLTEHMAYISTFQDKIIALAFTAFDIKLLDREGNILWSTVLNDWCGKIFFQPFYQPVFTTCIVENGKPMIIITEPGFRRITKLNGETGDVIKIFGTQGLYPFGVSADDNGILYTCDRNAREIRAWTFDFENHVSLISHTHGLHDHPRTLKYYGAKCELMVSNIDNAWSNYLQRFRVTCIR